MIKPILCPLIWYTTFPTTLEEDTILKDQPDILKELAKVYLETVTQNFNHLLIEFTGQFQSFRMAPGQGISFYHPDYVGPGGLPLQEIVQPS